jgi:hypothetical protein
VRSCAGIPNTTVTPKRESTMGETISGSSRPPAERRLLPVSISGIVSASRALRSQPPERICSS